MNHKRILSKSSLRSSPSSGKSANSCDDVSKLQAEVTNLRQAVEALKVSVENRDAAIGTLAREKEKLYVELKSAQRTNRNLHQQLIDERDIHSKEKEYFNDELSRQSQKDEKYPSDKKKSIKGSEMSLDEEITAKDAVIYNMGVKYLKLRANKRFLKKKLKEIQNQSQKTCKDIILLLEENRTTLDFLLNRLITSATVTPSSKKYLELLQINANLNFENIQLKVCLSNEHLLQVTSNENSHGNSNEQSDEDEPHAVTASQRSEHKPKNIEKHAMHTCYTGNKPFPPLQRSKRTKVNKLGNYRDFMHVHQELSPYFRRKIKRSKSDSCLIHL